MLAAGALVASLLAVGTGPVGAQAADSRLADTPDESTRLSACVGDALGDQMYVDVSDGHAFADAINCIGYYGITNGTGDGSTYSPNNDVSRAEMAVFIARAADKAGVDLGDAMGDEFTDLGDTWQEGRDAINQLASKGMIASGGAFRPDDAITRGEMASFLVGLLVKASPIVKIDSTNGNILLGTGAGRTADDWFQDARDSVPAANDAEIAAIYELGVTKGASAAAVQDETMPPLDLNYEPFGTVNRGEMAAFITRALAHTSVRPAGVSAQFDGVDVVVSARDDDFQPVSNVTVDVFRIDTGGIDLAFRGDGSCSEIDKVSGTGMHSCEIDGSDLLTGGGGDASVPLGDLDDGGTTVWAWTGDTEDTASEGMDGLYRLDIPEDAVTRTATQVRISTEYPDNKKVHLGSSVLYTVQLEDGKGPVTVGVDKKKPRPAQFFVTYAVTAFARVPDPADTDPSDGQDTLVIISPQGEATRTTLLLTTDSDGKATFSVAGLPDPDRFDNRDEYRVDIWIQPGPGGGNAPPSVNAAQASTGDYYVGATATDPVPDGQVTNTGVVTVREGARNIDAADPDPDGLIFSTERSNDKVINTTTALNATLPAGLTATDGPGVTVSAEPSTRYVPASVRGASNRATVSVTDQYGDPIVGARVSLTSSLAPAYNVAATATNVVIGGARWLAVGRDGSYTFGYTRVAPAATEATHALTETLVPTWDHDGDGCTADQVGDTSTPHRCSDLDPDPGTTTPGTAGIVGSSVTVEWARFASAAQPTGQQIREIDTDTNTIFAGVLDEVYVLSYDSNDRFNIDDDGAGSGTAESATYAAFERALCTTEGASGCTLTWLAIGSGSRAINSFTLTYTKPS